MNKKWVLLRECLKLSVWGKQEHKYTAEVFFFCGNYSFLFAKGCHPYIQDVWWQPYMVRMWGGLQRTLLSLSVSVCACFQPPHPVLTLRGVQEVSCPCSVRWESATTTHWSAGLLSWGWNAQTRGSTVDRPNRKSCRVCIFNLMKRWHIVAFGQQGSGCTHRDSSTPDFTSLPGKVTTASEWLHQHPAFDVEMSALTQPVLSYNDQCQYQADQSFTHLWH